jgi:hypothetical protein
MDICRPKTELSSTRFEENMWAVGFCELVCDNLRPVRGSVINDYELPVKVSRYIQSVFTSGDILIDSLEAVLFGEGAVQEPSDDRKVAAFIICRQNDRVFIFRSGGHLD